MDKVEAARDIVAILARLSAQDREEVIATLEGVFCFGCGIPQPVGRRCQCTNDD